MYKQYFTLNNLQWLRGCPRGVIVKAMDCRIVESKFVLQSHHYIHFRANTSYGLNSPTTVLLGE